MLSGHVTVLHHTGCWVVKPRRKMEEMRLGIQLQGWMSLIRLKDSLHLKQSYDALFLWYVGFYSLFGEMMRKILHELSRTNAYSQRKAWTHPGCSFIFLRADNSKVKVWFWHIERRECLLLILFSRISASLVYRLSFILMSQTKGFSFRTSERELTPQPIKALFRLPA